MKSHPRCSRGQAWRQRWLALACALASWTAQAAPEGLAQALSAAAARPERGLDMLQSLRATALVNRDLPARLAVDEAECQVRSDLDGLKALAVADAGLAAAGPEPLGAALDPWLRLRVCRAAILAERGDHAAASTEFEALLSLPAQRSTAGARAMALRERGVSRSRLGELENAQRDLIEACEALKALGEAREERTCIGHLAVQYRRAGDGEEALRLLVPLRDERRRAGAAYDDAVYTSVIGGVLLQLARWEEALQPLREAAQADLEAGDPIGASIAEGGEAMALLRLGRADEALQMAERALSHIRPRNAGPREFVSVSLTRAEALLALGRHAEARAQLQAIDPSARHHQEASVRLRWLEIHAQAMAEAGQWREAYDSLKQAQAIQAPLTAQKLSQESARLRMQFNRQRDADELAALRQLNDKGHQLRRAQAVALGLFVVLLAVAGVVLLRKMRQSRLLHAQASTDELTGLPNRRAVLAYLEQAADEARRSGGPVSVLMIDVDHFKRVNDTLGHDVGDEVLRHLARTMAVALRDRDRLGRLGGEEFVAVLPGTAAATAIQVAERMRAAVAAAPLVRPQGDVPVTVSLGVAGAADGAKPTRQLLAEADEALYNAKHSGRNAVGVHPQSRVGRA